MSFLDSLNTTSVPSELQNISNDAASALGLKRTLQNKKGVFVPPWDPRGKTPSLSKFFAPISIDETRWDQLFPYRLLVIDTTKNNAVVGGSFDVKTVVGAQAGTPILTFTPTTGPWVFNLPITPQQLSIADQFAINTSATLRGILEEHNGIRFKMLTAAGSLGVWPYRESVTNPPQSPGLLNSLFGGTINAAQGLVQQVGTVINTFTTNHPANKPNTVRPESSSAGPASTGYYQALMLQQFLEQYAEAKKNPINAGWRLIFDIPKQNQSFVVSPMQFVWQQSVNKPLEINFNMQFKVWRRIDLKETPQILPATPYTLTPGILQRILNTITEARLVCSSSIALIGAVRSDVNGIFSVLSQLALFTKDLLGVAAAASDLGPSIVNDYKSAIQQYASLNSSQVSAALTSAAALGALATIIAATNSREGITQNAAAGGQLGNQVAYMQSTDATNRIFNNPNAFAELLDQIPANQLNLNTAQQNRLNQIVSDARQLSADQINTMAGNLLSLALQLSNHFGAGDAFYDKVYNLPPPTPRIQPMTLDEYNILDALYEAIESCYIYTATTQVDDINIQSTLSYVAGLANQSGIEFSIPNSKILAPVPFGSTIEAIAQRYLGNPNRWIEIATLNDLREPYIDESGFQLPLLSNGIGRQIIVGSSENLYFNQVVILKSTTQVPSARHITGIRSLSSTSFLITLDGAPNVSSFTTADGAYMQAYLPGTVNSQQKIFIPSDNPPPVNNTINVIPPNIAASDPLTGLSKVDLLLTEEGDLALDSFGDFRLSYGLTNIIQAVKIKLGSVQGTILTHPEFGLGVQVGVSSSDVDVQNLYNAINNQIQQDPRFQGVNTLQIKLSGPSLSIAMNVSIAGQTGTLPLSFQLGN